MGWPPYATVAKPLEESKKPGRAKAHWLATLMGGKVKTKNILLKDKLPQKSEYIVLHAAKVKRRTKAFRVGTLRETGMFVLFSPDIVGACGSF